MEMSNEKNEIFKALNNFRTKLKQPKKDKTNPFFRSTYVDLSGVTKAVDEALKDTGLAFFQNPVKSEIPNQVGIKTIITHSSGQFIEFDPFVVPVGGKHDAQAFGSAKTYASRYSLATAFGVTDSVDDDGNATKTTKNNNQRQTQSIKKQNQESEQKEKVERARNKIKSMAREFDKVTGTKPGATLQMVCEIKNVDIKTNSMTELTKVGEYLKEKLDEKSNEGVAND
ncbi:hypothetical protein BGL41_04590 [Fructilactobacillus sanfranciscensis]|uniref:ERF family protein n=1 Tax=Fructilactobacillus sanfranciscensis TaxID=1625 RepID=UPI000CD3BC59|nr:ERF family protein [Fructilactobacillus sanfranciscensis]POH13404.1 hypothetical protein BGL41_04590 [Fructilactobacillus sanfranciscensis]